MIPAAGFARRLPGIRGSKEAHPIPPRGDPAVAATLRAMARADVRDVIVVTRPEKRDLVQALGDGRTWGVTLEYVYTEPTRGPAETIDRAWELLQGSNVAFSFGDILMKAEDPFSPLLEALGPFSPSTDPPTDAGRRPTTEGAPPAAVLGLFPISPLQPADPVRLTPEGHVAEILPKGAPPPGPWCWGIAAWSPRVTTFIHARVDRESKGKDGHELGIGAVLNDALSQGMPMTARPVSREPFLDIGTPRGLRWAEEGKRSAPLASR